MSQQLQDDLSAIQSLVGISSPQRQALIDAAVAREIDRQSSSSRRRVVRHSDDPVDDDGELVDNYEQQQDLTMTTAITEHTEYPLTPALPASEVHTTAARLPLSSDTTIPASPSTVSNCEARLPPPPPSPAQKAQAIAKPRNPVTPHKTSKPRKNADPDSPEKTTKPQRVYCNTVSIRSS